MKGVPQFLQRQVSSVGVGEVVDIVVRPLKPVLRMVATMRRIKTIA